MNKLILLVGNIGSGKSTLAEKYAKKKYVIVSRDAVRVMIAGGGYLFDVNVEPLVYKVERYALLLFLQAGYNVVVDETNVSKKSRSKLIALGQEYNYKIIAHVLPQVSKEESVKRRMAGDARNYKKQTWVNVWELFNNAYKDPLLQEGFHEIIFEKTKGKPIKVKQPVGSRKRKSHE